MIISYVQAPQAPNCKGYAVYLHAYEFRRHVIRLSIFLQNWRAANRHGYIIHVPGYMIPWIPLTLPKTQKRTKHVYKDCIISRSSIKVMAGSSNCWIVPQVQEECICLQIGEEYFFHRHRWSSSPLRYEHYHLHLSTMCWCVRRATVNAIAFRLSSSPFESVFRLPFQCASIYGSW